MKIFIKVEENDHQLIQNDETAQLKFVSDSRPGELDIPQSLATGFDELVA